MEYEWIKNVAKLIDNHTFIIFNGEFFTNEFNFSYIQM